LTSSPVLSRGSRPPVRRFLASEHARRACPVKPFSFMWMALGGSRRKFQAVRRPSLACAFGRHPRSVSNSWSRCSARRPAMLRNPLACEARFSERYREGFEEDKIEHSNRKCHVASSWKQNILSEHFSFWVIPPQALYRDLLNSRRGRQARRRRRQAPHTCRA